MPSAECRAAGRANRASHHKFANISSHGKPTHPKARLSKSDKRAVDAVHLLLRQQFPKAFPEGYDLIIPLKTGVLADLAQRLPDIDPALLRRALANHTARDGYLLALAHGRGDRRYDLEGNPAGTVTPEERAEALKKLAASTERGQAKAERVRTHKEREEQRRKQREIERKNREAKAARKAAHELKMQEVAVRKAALEAQGIQVESRSERKRRLIREAAERAQQHHTQRPIQSSRPDPQPGAIQRPKLSLKPKPDAQTVAVEFKKRRRFNPDDASNDN